MLRLLIICPLLMSACVAIFASPVLAGWSGDPFSSLPICTAGGKQFVRQTVADGFGGMIVVWDDERPIRGIYAQRVSAAGILRWATNGIPVCTVPIGQEGAVAVPDGAGGVIVAWLDWRNYLELYAQRFDADGNPLWTPNGVLVDSFPSGSGLSIVPDGDSGAILIWNSGAGNHLLAQRMDGFGGLPWSSPITLDTGDDFDCAATSDGAGGAIIAWRLSSVTGGVAVQRIDHNGAVLWVQGGKRLQSWQGVWDRVSALGDGAGGGWLGFTDETDVQLLRLLPDGSEPWALPVRLDRSVPRGAPALVAAGGGDVIAGWAVWPDSIPFAYAQRVNASGARMWTMPGISLSDSRYADYLTATGDDAGGALFAWSAGGVWARHVDGAGTMWPTRVLISSGPVFDFSIVPDGSKGALFAWTRHLSGDDIFGQRVLDDGTLAGPAVSVPPTDPDPLRFGIRPLANPATDRIAARITLPRSEPVELTLTDIVGRRIARERFVLEAGGHDLSLGRAREHPPGLYFLRAEAGGLSRTVRLTITR